MSAFKLFYTERNRLFNVIQYAPLWYIPVSFWHTTKRYVSQARSAEVADRAKASGLTFSKTIGGLVKAYTSGLKLFPHFWNKRKSIQQNIRISSKDILSLIKTYGTRDL